MQSQRRVLVSAVSCFALLVAALADRTEEEDVTIELSQPVYYFSEMVEFTVTNLSDSVLTFTSHPPFNIYSVSTGEQVYYGYYLPMETYLYPQQSETFEWDQHYHEYGTSGDQVPPGDYWVEVGFWYGTHATGWWGTVADTFEIRDPCPAQRDTWGRIRGLWF